LATPAPDVALHDYDTIGIPENATPAWRIEADRLWLDTTELVIEEATRQVAGWMQEQRRRHRAGRGSLSGRWWDA